MKIFWEVWKSIFFGLIIVLMFFFANSTYYFLLFDTSKHFNMFSIIAAFIVMVFSSLSFSHSSFKFNVYFKQTLQFGVFICFAASVLGFKHHEVFWIEEEMKVTEEFFEINQEAFLENFQYFKNKRNYYTQNNNALLKKIETNFKLIANIENSKHLGSILKETRFLISKTEHEDFQYLNSSLNNMILKIKKFEVKSSKFQNYEHNKIFYSLISSLLLLTSFQVQGIILILSFIETENINSKEED